MAKREKRAQLFGKLGLASAAIALIGGVATLIIMAQRWSIPEGKITESVIYMKSGRAIAVYLGLFLTFLFGVFGFLAGLEGTTSTEGQIRKLGWLAFWIGAVFTMVAIVLGLCMKAYST